MFRRRPRRHVPALNTTSTADISFMLLIFFLVTSSMDTDKGLPRQLPPQEPEQMEETQDIHQRNILTVRLGADDRITCGDETLDVRQLQARVETFVRNEDNDPAMPEKTLKQIPFLGRCAVTDKHIISIEADRAASYNAYFEMQNGIIAAYHHLRDELSRRKFGYPYEQCTQEERQSIMQYYPQRISESLPVAQEGGGR
ncbi:MAG: biopolymer transporter ExbD [Prevotella sp.]|nr:biopolymer transporter ExbD [Prevotella sp.]